MDKFKTIKTVPYEDICYGGGGLRKEIEKQGKQELARLLAERISDVEFGERYVLELEKKEKRDSKTGGIAIEITARFMGFSEAEFYGGRILEGNDHEQKEKM